MALVLSEISVKSFNCLQFFRKYALLRCLKSNDRCNKYLALPHSNFHCYIRFLSHSSGLNSQKKFDKPGFKIKTVVTEDGEKEVKKKVYIPRITMFSPDEAMQVVSMDEAEKIAQRRNLKLLKVSDLDPKSGRPVYKLLTVSDYAAHSKKESSKKTGSGKDEKLLTVSSKITDNDLQPKIKHILKWLSKEHTVRVVITVDSSNLTPGEKIFDTISNSVKDAGRVVQKICKGSEIKFQIILPKKAKVKATSDSVAVEPPVPSNSAD